MGEAVFTEEKYCPHVDILQLVPIRGIEINYRGECHHGGIVDHDVYFAIGAYRVVYTCLYLIRISNIYDH